ncbi:hypothetical protein BH23BAC1_BH23BAC1_19340 [soil metagenome]
MPATSKFILLIMVGLSLIFISFTTTKTQLIKTTLRITILNELGNPVEGAQVQLYKTDEDYSKNTNPATEPMLTDSKGVVTFKDLEPIEYYVNAEKGEANNYGAGVQTGKLEAKRINRATIIIE